MTAMAVVLRTVQRLFSGVFLIPTTKLSIPKVTFYGTE
jgi:hypothetical protein